MLQAVQALAGRLSALGHDIRIGTRDVAASLARTTPDGWGNPAIGTWIAQHPARFFAGISAFIIREQYRKPWRTDSGGFSRPACG